MFAHSKAGNINFNICTLNNKFLTANFLDTKIILVAVYLFSIQMKINILKIYVIDPSFMLLDL